MAGRRKKIEVVEVSDSEEEMNNKSKKTTKSTKQTKETEKDPVVRVTKKSEVVENKRTTSKSKEDDEGEEEKPTTKRKVKEVQEKKKTTKRKSTEEGTKDTKKSKKETKEEEIVPFKKGFKMATKEQQIAALAFSSDIPKELFPYGKYTNQNGVEQLFFPDIPHPIHEDDWLAQYNVRQQSFNKWKEIHRKIREGRDKIYFLPFGDFKEGPDLDLLVEYAKIIYSPLKIEKLPNLEILHSKEGSCVKHAKNTRRGTSNVTTRLDTRRCHHYYKETYVKDHRQIGLDGLGRVLEDMRPSDAYCILGFTMEDLFTDDTDEFTVGAANMEGAGGFSFARYDPNFSSKAKNEGKPKISAEEIKKILFRRCMKVMIHEIGHMFGLDHCVYFHCLMNGSGHIVEDDSQPLHMCPIDLRKLTYALQDDKRSKDFSIIRMQYELLHDFYEKHNLTEDKHWAKSMMQYLDNNK